MSTPQVEGAYATFSPYIGPTRSVDVPSQIGSTPSTVEYRLTRFGTMLAVVLADVLDELRKHNPRAVYSIISILEPYIEATEELNLDMPPLSSTTVIAKVIDRGTAEPEFYFE